MKLIFTILTLILVAPHPGQADEKKQTLPEYSAAEATKHIGETARVTGKVGCVVPNHGGGYSVGLGDCDDNGIARPRSAQGTLFWVVTHGDVSGPKLDVEESKASFSPSPERSRAMKRCGEFSSSPLRK